MKNVKLINNQSLFEYLNKTLKSLPALEAKLLSCEARGRDVPSNLIATGCHQDVVTSLTGRKDS